MFKNYNTLFLLLQETVWISPEANANIIITRKFYLTIGTK